MLALWMVSIMSTDIGSFSINLKPSCSIILIMKGEQGRGGEESKKKGRSRERKKKRKEREERKIKREENRRVK